jgi:hypothetical protein
MKLLKKQMVGINGWTFKLLGALCGRDLIDPKSFK